MPISIYIKIWAFGKAKKGLLMQIKNSNFWTHQRYTRSKLNIFLTIVFMKQFLFLWILYSFSGFGQGVHTPSFAMRLLGQGLQCLWYLSGTKPLGHFLHKPWKSTFSSTWHFEQEFLKPFGKEPSAHCWQSPVLLTI